MPRAFRMMSSSGRSAPRIQARTSSAGRPSAPAPLSSSFFASAIGRPLLLIAHGRPVAYVLNLLDERLLLHGVLVEVDDGRLAAKRHVDAPDARRLFEGLLDERGARLAVHPVNVKLGLHLQHPPRKRRPARRLKQ